MYPVAASFKWEGRRPTRRTFIAVIGRQNAGKSELINRLSGGQHGYDVIRKVGQEEIDRSLTFVERVQLHAAEEDLGPRETQARYKDDLNWTDIPPNDNLHYNTNIRHSYQEGDGAATISTVLLDTRGIRSDDEVGKHAETLDESVLRFIFRQCRLIFILVPVHSLRGLKGELNYLEKVRLKSLGLYEPSETSEDSAQRIQRILAEYRPTMKESCVNQINSLFKTMRSAVPTGSKLPAKPVPQGAQVWENVRFVITQMDLADASDLKSVYYDTGRSLERFLVHAPHPDQVCWISVGKPGRPVSNEYDLPKLQGLMRDASGSTDVANLELLINLCDFVAEKAWGPWNWNARRRARAMKAKWARHC
ncbi:unnamed protein product [Prorocentrum cordatum]|uniref:G domain-containing protein n=1 Tax=Prorocentrum cordatum TaxID=2364126 RepID=A0ABN9SCC6_9DINO|nr:unnamed protein product [Polarella glacialis]